MAEDKNVDEVLEKNGLSRDQLPSSERQALEDEIDQQ